MRISSAILVGSLITNVVLVGSVLLNAGGDETTAVLPKAAASPGPIANVEPTQVWTELHADDLTQQAAKLRADGFPPAVIRAIITAQVRAQFAGRRKAIEAQTNDVFWKPQDPASQAALRALALEEQRLVKSILGSDPLHGHAASLRRQFPNFPDEVIDAIAGIRERYDERRMELYMQNRGGATMLPDEREKIEALDKAMRTEIAGALPPALLDEYELRTSNTANQLRYELVAFNPTEQEFRTLHRLKSVFDEEHRYRGPQTDEQMRARSAAQARMNDQIKAEFGEARFAEYQRATDYNYRQTSQLVARLNLPPETANTLYTIQKEFEQLRSDLFRRSNGPPGSPGYELMVKESMALQQQAVARIAPVLGNQRFVEDYKQYGGSWLTNFVPTPPTRTAPPPPKSG